MTNYTAKVWLLLLASLCAATFADRLPPDSDETAKIYILDSPLYEPLSGVALHVDQFFKGIPSVTRNVEEDEMRHKVMSIAKRLNRIKPALQHIVILATSPSTPSAASKGLDTAFDSLRSMLGEAHRRTNELASYSNDVLFLSPMQHLLNSIQKALYHASSLSPSLVPTVYRVHPMMEKFIIHEYIPHAEKVYSLNQNLETARKKPHEVAPHKTIESLIDQWSEAHDKIKESSISLLKLVDIMKGSVRKNADTNSLQHLSAFVSLLDEGDQGDKFGSLGPDAINRRLNRIETRLLAIAHKKSPVVRKKKDKLVPLPKVISMLHQIENMVEKLTHLHDDLHSTQDKLRYVAARLNKSKEDGHDEIIKKNNAIRTQLNRLHNDISHAHEALRNHMAHCITSDAEKSAPEIDFMSPMLRFAELEKKIKSNAHAERFTKELEEIRQMLFKLHNDAHRFNRFEQIMKARKAKLITE